MKQNRYNFRGGMDGPPSVDLVAKAINTLYDSPDPQQKEEAGRQVLFSVFFPSNLRQTPHHTREIT